MFRKVLDFPYLKYVGYFKYDKLLIIKNQKLCFQIDVWAAGVILYILLCGYPPFVSQDNDQEKLFDCILSGQYDFPDEYWQDVSGQAKELIQNMLQLQPDVRFSAEDVLDHPWLQIANC